MWNALLGDRTVTALTRHMDFHGTLANNLASAEVA